MITVFITLVIALMLLGVAFKLTGALLKALLWLVLLLPIGLLLWAIGIVCCCTLLLIPLGVILFKAGAHIIIPG